MRLRSILLAAVLLILSVFGQILLFKCRPSGAPVMADGALAVLGGLRSLAAEVVWFRADRLQEEGRYVELAQLAGTLTFLEPHTPEVWSYAAWNLSYNVSILMPTAADRWRWVQSGLRLLRDDGLALNPNSKALCREIAWLFAFKLGTDLDTAAGYYRQEWRRMVEDVRQRGAWAELKMEPEGMRQVEQATGFTDWTDPQLSAIYWSVRGNCADVFRQASVLYRKNHGMPTQSR